MLLYLIHYNNSEKTQYDMDEVDGELAKDLINLIQSKTENNGEKLDKILRFVYASKNITIAEITEYCIKYNYYEILKQNQYLISKIIQERIGNKNVSKKLFSRES